MAMDQENTVPLPVIQNGLFGILKYIRDVCDRNGLKYFLAYGTLIGAVRHQGFVPWDDDMDIQMPREDFLKFAETSGIAREAALKMIQKLLSMQDSYLRICEDSDLSSHLKDRFSSLIEERINALRPGN